MQRPRGEKPAEEGSICWAGKRQGGRGEQAPGRRSSLPGEEFDSILQAVGEPWKVYEQGNNKTKTSF